MILSWIEIVHVWHVHSTGDTGSTVHVGVAVFRLIRLFRLIRVMKFFKRLNTLVNAFIGALKDIIWVGVLIILMLYAFAVLTTNFFGKNDYLVAQMGNDSSSDMFGSVARSMATLFQMMTLDSWMSGITRPIGDVYAGAFPFFIFFVLLGSLGMLNLLTAIFVESLWALQEETAELQQQQEAEEREKLVDFIKRTFQRFDDDGSGVLESTEVARAMEAFASPEYEMVMKSLGLSVSEMRDVTRLCDADGDGSVQYDEFCHGIINLKKPPTKRDTWELSHQATTMQRKIEEEVRKMKTEILAELREELQANASKLDRLLEYNGLSTS